MGFSKDEMAPNADSRPLQSSVPPTSNLSEPITDTNSRKRARSPQRGGRARGSPGGRGTRGSRNKRSDMGRSEYNRNSVDKRARNEAAQEAAKRRKLANEKEDRPIYAVEYSKEEIEKEERRPKRKVAVMIGYSGSGYKGMQLNHKEKTIEGDLFGAFVAAGAVSKANADDPKKSSLVRCARTDKGVHAAGNVISMKLIIEDEDIVQKINDNLSPQIRVWGMERTNGAFSAYQLCDSRIYEYLIPTHCFLPPHPESFLGRKLVELAAEAEDLSGLEERQREVSSFWSDTEAQYIAPILDGMEPSTRQLVISAIYDSMDDEHINDGEVRSEKSRKRRNEHLVAAPTSTIEGDAGIAQPTEVSPLDAAIKELKNAYIQAKKAYRIHPDRLARVGSTLSRYVGTQNYHNYTIGKSPTDPSAKRVIRSFVVNRTPIIINDTEWLSLKVHGQSFMMHQIRKMVSMVALVVRCGCHEGRIQDSYTKDRYTIPKAPGLGLLLERPVFDTYNQRLENDQSERLPIDFTKYDKEMEEFKQREIYERIFQEEEHDNQFHTLFAMHDNLKASQLLYLSSLGFAATRKVIASEDADTQGDSRATLDDASSEDDANPEDG